MSSNSKRQAPGQVLETVDDKIWHKSAPRAVKEAYKVGADGFSVWAEHLDSRELPLSLSELLESKGSPLKWVVPDGFDVEHLLRTNRACPGNRATEGKVLTWLSDVSVGTLDEAYALEALAWCHALPDLAMVVSSGVWWELLNYLFSTVSEARQIDIVRSPLSHQLLAGELGLTLGYLLPEISEVSKLVNSSKRVLSDGIVELTDGQGNLHADNVECIRSLLACWTRCVALGTALRDGCFDKAARNQYQWFVQNALRMTRANGTPAFSSGSWCAELFDVALRMSGGKEDVQIAKIVLPSREKRASKNRNELALPEPAVESEWAALAVLRPFWGQPGTQLTVLYPAQTVRLELGCKREVIWSGRWQWEVARDGKAATPISDWEQICWVSDEDVDYLELQIQLSGGMRMQRQILMAREDAFLLLSDVLLSERPGLLEYRGCLPLCSGIEFQRADQTREGILVGKKPRAQVMPLALPEWKDAEGIGILEQSEHGLELRQSYEGFAMFAPLMFDLSPKRFGRSLTWRRLTVAEDLQKQPDDVAVGYRVMIGKEQWLIYRSLTATANRTLLGHNLSTEMLVAQFDRSGEVEPMLEVR